jgi:large subunit ribosomal protein L24
MQRIKKGDTVQVISGRDEGKRGKVLEVWPEEGLVRVEGVAIQKRHMKPGSNQKFPNGGIVDRPAKISLSQVMFYSEKLGRPVRVGIKDLGEGKKIRVARGKGLEEAALD